MDKPDKSVYELTDEELDKELSFALSFAQGNPATLSQEEKSWLAALLIESITRDK